MAAVGAPGAAFEREHGCTTDDWLRMLPGAAATHALTWLPPDAARIRIGGGLLHLAWRELPPRRIALVRIPRLTVSYRFDGVDEAARAEFLRYFDLYMQRGGG